MQTTQKCTIQEVGMEKLMQESKNRQELFDNTIRHFNSKNRATDANGNCYYRKDVNVGCAIGREVSDTLAYQLDEAVRVSADSTCLFAMLPHRLRNMGQKFLASIQSLHDTESNWNETGLSDAGQIEAKLIAQQYNLYYK